MAVLADDVAMQDAINTSEAHFIGYSMGGQVGFGIAKHSHHTLIELALPNEAFNGKLGYIH